MAPPGHPVLQAERERAAALVARDLPRLQALLHADLRYTHAPGTTHDLAGYLGYVADGPRFDEVTLVPDRVLDLGAGAVVTGRLHCR